MTKIRVCFMGTPQFAVTCLQSLLDGTEFEVVGVVTQPDRPAGRKLQLTPSAVKLLAMEKKLPIVTPDSLKTESEHWQVIRSWNADVAVVVAFGQILTENFMSIFPHGCVNVHASLLPKWRGAAPIQRSIEAGDQVTGVALQKMVKKLDAGDVIGVRQCEIGKNQNALELHDVLAKLGAETLTTDLITYVRGQAKLTVQDETQVTYAKKIENSEALIDWNLSAKLIHQKVRAFVLGPGTYTLLQQKKIKIHRCEVVDQKTNHRPGVIEQMNPDSLDIACGEQVLRIFELQPESRQRMFVADFLKGHQLKKGDSFGE